MDAIKKKMQAMKLEKDNAMDRADACEQQAKDANLRAERVRRGLVFRIVPYFLLFVRLIRSDKEDLQIPCDGSKKIIK